MPYLSNEQLKQLADQVIEDYGSELINGELIEAIGLMLENIAGFEAVDSRSLTDMINHIRNHYYESTSQTSSTPES